MSASLAESLALVVGRAHVSVDPDVLEGRSVDHTGRYRGRASALVRPGSPDEVAAVLRECRDAGAHVTIQGGRTSLVAGTVPEPATFGGVFAFAASGLLARRSRRRR